MKRENLTHLLWSILNSRIHVAFLPMLLTMYWQAALNLKLSVAYYIMITANTMGGYLINLVTDQSEDSVNYPRSGWVFSARSRWVRFVIIGCTGLSLFLAIRSGWRVVLLGAALNFLGGIYGYRWQLPDGRTFRIKAVAWIKNAYSAAMWAVGVIATPILYTRGAFSRSVLLAGFVTFLLVLFVELLWDVRDMLGDRVMGVQTIPVCLGESFARQTLHMTNILSVAIILGGVLLGIFPPTYWIMLPHAVIVFAFVQWYFYRADRQSASHLYLLYAAGVVGATVLVSKFEVSS